MPLNWPPKRRGPKRQPWPSKPGLNQGDIPDGGTSVQVIAYWEGFWASRRAAQLQQLSDYSVVVTVTEESTRQGFIARIPFQGFGRNPYVVSNGSYETSAPQPDTTPIWLARPKFLPFGQSQFRFGQNLDLSFVAPLDVPGFLARPQFLPFGRTQFRFGATYDDSFTTPAQDYVAAFIARPQYSQFGKTQFRFGQNLDDSAPAVQEWITGFIARPNLSQWFFNRFVWTHVTDVDVILSFEYNPWIFTRWMQQPYDARKAASRLHSYSTLDDSTAGPVIAAEVMVVIPETPGAIKVHVLVEHPTTTRVVVDSPNKVIVTTDQDPTAIPLKVVI